MLSIITSYLLQTGKCVLPHIGIFSTVYTPAINDIIKKQILPPAEEIVFREERMLFPPDMIKYISLKKNITEDEAVNQLDAFCKSWKEKIDEGEKFCLQEVGCLQKNEFGKIIFVRESGVAYDIPVPAEVVLNENFKPAGLASGHDITSGTEYFYNRDIEEKRSWYLWAVALFIISIIIIMLSFFNQKLTTFSVGNRGHIIIKPIEQTHFEISQ